MIYIPEEIKNDPKTLHEYLAEQERLQREQDRAEGDDIVSEWF